MAEYLDIMKQKVRMCNCYKDSIFCETKDGENCPLKGKICSKYSRCITDADIRESEEIILKWAAEHPEPVYPTWSEWLVHIGVFPQMISVNPIKAMDAISKGVSKPIPADIAEKLGIEPKEDV